MARINKIINNGTEYCMGGGSVPYVEVLVVGGGGGGGSQSGGGGGEVTGGTVLLSKIWPKKVYVGAGGCGRVCCCSGCNVEGTGGGASCFGDIIAKGGCYPSSSGCGGTSGSGYVGGHTTTSCASGGGGGGAGGEGCLCNCQFRGTAGGPGLCGYGGGGGGGGRFCAGRPGGAGGEGGGGAGAPYYIYCGGPYSDGTNCGGGGGGKGNYCAKNNGCGESYYRAGNGAGGLVIVCYACDGANGFSCATGGTKVLCNGYYIHCFTSDGEFSIIS